MKNQNEIEIAIIIRTIIIIWVIIRIMVIIAIAQKTITVRKHNS